MQRWGDVCFDENFIYFNVLGKNDKYALDLVIGSCGLEDEFNRFCCENKKLSNTKKYLRFFDMIQRRDNVKDINVKLSLGFQTKRDVYGEMAEYV